MPAETHVERGPLDRKQVFELIRDRLADILEIEPGEVTDPIEIGDAIGVSTERARQLYDRY